MWNRGTKESRKSKEKISKNEIEATATFSKIHSGWFPLPARLCAAGGLKCRVPFECFFAARLTYQRRQPLTGKRGRRWPWVEGREDTNNLQRRDKIAESHAESRIMLQLHTSPGVVGGFDLPDEPTKPGTVTRSKVELSPFQRGHDAADAAPRMRCGKPRAFGNGTPDQRQG